MDTPIITDSTLWDLQRGRNILIKSDIDKDLALRVMLVLREMDSESREPIRILLDSAGGDVQSGLSIIDAMEVCRSPIHTVCVGMAASMAAVIFCCGDKGHRTMMRHSRLMVHQPWGSVSSFYMKETDMKVMSDEMTRTREALEGILSERTGLSPAEVSSICENDHYMGVYEAMRLGFADGILSPSDYA